jgi:hypothetical protein
MKPLEISRKLVMTPYHAKFYTHELNRDGGEGVDRLGLIPPCFAFLL